ncbi:MAG: hypothetical protein AAB868_03135 [Patescibacteria group bacterium]
MKKTSKFFTPSERNIISKKLGLSRTSDDKKLLAMMLIMMKNGSFYTGAELGAWQEGDSRAEPIKQEIYDVLKSIFDIDKITNGDMYEFVRQIWAKLLDRKIVNDSGYQVIKKQNKLVLQQKVG